MADLDQSVVPAKLTPPAGTTVVRVGQVWRTVHECERWRVDELDPYGEAATVRMVALEGRWEGQPDVLFTGELKSCAALVEDVAE